jgi:predicted carbohydrate-binding protein with CBM5 and CBM33 domain
VRAHRRAAVLIGGGVTLYLLGAAAAGPASAHGALSAPTSRAAVCGTEAGSRADSAACTAALAASGRQSFADWDEVRVPGVAGRDREVIPDGKLCSGGLTRYRGLDLPRADWPSTALTAGAAFRFSYRATIPHAGTFRLYLTTDNYRPTAPLTWAEIERTPFLTVTDPPLTGGSYVLSGRLPRKAGRHLIYTVGQNTSTADTYYSCSDVVFRTSGGTGGGPVAGNPTAKPAPAPPAAPPTAAPTRPAPTAGSTPARTEAAPPAAEPAAEPAALPAVRSVSWTSRDPTKLVLAATGAAVLLAAATLLAVARR